MLRRVHPEHPASTSRGWAQGLVYRSPETQAIFKPAICNCRPESHLIEDLQTILYFFFMGLAAEDCMTYCFWALPAFLNAKGELPWAVCTSSKRWLKTSIIVGYGSVNSQPSERSTAVKHRRILKIPCECRGPSTQPQAPLRPHLEGRHGMHEGVAPSRWARNFRPASSHSSRTPGLIDHVWKFECIASSAYM